MRTKIIFLLSVILFVFVSCTEKHIVINIPIHEKDALDYKKFDKIFFTDFKIKSSITTPNPEIELLNFFTNEFQHSINRKIEHLKIKIDLEKPTDTIKERLKNYPNSLLITGEFGTDIQSRSIVKDIKDKVKKKKKAFVKIQLWEMTMKVIMIESDSFKIIREDNFSAKLKDADPKKVHFNFKSLFDKITEGFLQKSKRKTRIQKRILLSK